MAIPAVANGQAPVVDQYAPSVPTSDGPEAPPEPEPDTQAGSGGFDGGSDTGDGNGGTGSPSGGSGDSGSGEASTSATSSANAPLDSANATGAAAGGNRDQETLAGLAAGAEQERQEAASRPGEPAAALSRTGTSGTDTATMIFLWSVLGVTALWAIATLIRRRRDEDGHPA